MVSNTIYLRLVTSLLMSLHHPSCHDHWFPRTVSKVLLCFSDDDHKCKSYLVYAGNVNDKLFSGHVKFSVQNFIA